MASTKEVNAAFDVIHSKLVHLINEKLSWPVHDKALAFIESADGRKALVDGIREGLEAAEKARAE